MAQGYVISILAADALLVASIPSCSSLGYAWNVRAFKLEREAREQFLKRSLLAQIGSRPPRPSRI